MKACDVKSVPLLDEAIDIAVFSLSLMGKNWPDYIKEAKRCLATNGYLLIAETTKSMKGWMEDYQSLRKSLNRDLISIMKKRRETLLLLKQENYEPCGQVLLKALWLYSFFGKLFNQLHTDWVLFGKTHIL